MDEDSDEQAVTHYANRDPTSSAELSARGNRYYDEDVGDPLQPPFIANSVRNDAIYHYERLKELGSLAPVDDASPTQSSAVQVLTRVGGRTEAPAETERLNRVKMLRDMLMGDLKDLLSKIQELEVKLEGRSGQYEISNRKVYRGISLGLLGIGTWCESLIPIPYSYYNKSVVQKLGVLSLAIGAYDIYGVYDAHRFRKALGCTTVVKDKIIQCGNRIIQDLPLDDEDIAFLEGELWDAVPWNEVENRKAW